MINELNGGAFANSHASEYEILHRMEEELHVLWVDCLAKKVGGYFPQPTPGFALASDFCLLSNFRLSLIESFNPVFEGLLLVCDTVKFCPWRRGFRKNGRFAQTEQFPATGAEPVEFFGFLKPYKEWCHGTSSARAVIFKDILPRSTSERT
jgi:hypothetical protein